jgi:hypothetical protein
MAPKLKTTKNSKLPKFPENYFEPVGKGGWPPISTWIIHNIVHLILCKETYYKSFGGCDDLPFVL